MWRGFRVGGFPRVVHPRSVAGAGTIVTDKEGRQAMRDDNGVRVYLTGARFGQEMADRKKREREGGKS